MTQGLKVDSGPKKTKTVLTVTVFHTLSLHDRFKDARAENVNPGKHFNFYC